MSIENTGQYRGVYHILGGIISPINGIGPSNLTIGRLVERLRAILHLIDQFAHGFGEVVHIFLRLAEQVQCKPQRTAGTYSRERAYGIDCVLK